MLLFPNPTTQLHLRIFLFDAVLSSESVMLECMCISFMFMCSCVGVYGNRHHASINDKYRELLIVSAVVNCIKTFD